MNETNRDRRTFLRVQHPLWRRLYTSEIMHRPTARKIFTDTQRQRPVISLIWRQSGRTL